MNRAEVKLYIVVDDWREEHPKLITMVAKREPTRYRVLTRRDAINFGTFLRLDDSRIAFDKKEAVAIYLKNIRDEEQQAKATLARVAWLKAIVDKWKV